MLINKKNFVNMTNWKIVGLILILFVLQQVVCKKMVMMEQEQTLLVPLRNTKQANCECGKLTRKIDDERLAKVKISGGRLPWLAELVTSFGNFEIDADEFRLCFGTVVSLQAVLFPASCIDTNAIKKPKVKLIGIDDRKESLKEIRSITFHTNYRRKNDNDIALVKLKNIIDYNQTKIVPICLLKTGKSYPIKYPEKKGGGKLKLNIWNDNTGFANSEEEEDDDDESRMRPCRNPQPPCEKRPCPPCPSTTTRAPSKAVKPKPKPPQFVLTNSVTRTWFYRKSVGYDYIQHYGRFDVQKVNNSRCHELFPEMLKSKVTCVLQKEIRDIARQNGKFFNQLELGMPLMLANTTLIKGKPQVATTKYYLDGIRAPGSSGGIPLLESRESTIALLKIEDYVTWIEENSQNEHFCKN